MTCIRLTIGERRRASSSRGPLRQSPKRLARVMKAPDCAQRPGGTSNELGWCALHLLQSTRAGRSVQDVTPFLLRRNRPAPRRGSSVRVSVALVLIVPLIAVWAPPTMKAHASVCQDPGAFTNNGGPFMSDPRIYLIFWGPGWQSNPNNIIGTQQELFSTLSGSSYNGALGQYCISNDVSFAGEWWDSGSTPNQPLTEAETFAEVDGAVSQNPAWVRDGNSLFEVLPQPGTSYADPITTNAYCAYHDTTSSRRLFSVVPYAGDAMNGKGLPTVCESWFGPTPELAMTALASHEYSEAATDPDLANGWRWNGSEIGDVCEYTPQRPHPWGNFGSVTTQWLWDNPTNDCNIRPESIPPMAPAGPSLALWQASGQQDVFWRGTDGNLWEDVWSQSGGGWWASPGHLSNGPMGSEPGAVTNPARNEEDVFWQGMGGQLYEAVYSTISGTWSVGPVQPSVVGMASQPSVAAKPSGQQDVFWQGSDGKLWETYWSVPNGWSPAYEPISSGILGSAPAVVWNNQRNEEDVFWRGTDGNLWEAYFHGGWNGPHLAVGASIGSQPSVGAWASNGQQDVFWRATDSALVKAFWNPNNGWNTPGDVANTAPMFSAPTGVVNNAFGQDDVFWKASIPGSGLWEVYWQVTWQYPPNNPVPNTSPLG